MGVRVRAIDWDDRVPMMARRPWVFVGEDVIPLRSALEALDDAVYGMVATVVRAHGALDRGDVEDVRREDEGPAA